MLVYENDTDRKNNIKNETYVTAGNTYFYNENLILVIVALYFLSGHKDDRRSSSMPSLNMLIILILILLYYSNCNTSHNGYMAMPDTCNSLEFDSDYIMLNCREKPTTDCPYEGGYEEGNTNATLRLNKYNKSEKDTTTIPYEGGFDSNSLEYHTSEESHENSQHELVENYNLNEVPNEVDISSISYNTGDKDNPVLSYTPANEKQIISNTNAEDNLALSNIGVVNNPEVNSINDRETTIPYEGDYDSDSLEYDTIKKSHENSQHELVENCNLNEVPNEVDISSISYNTGDKDNPVLSYTPANGKQIISNINAEDNLVLNNIGVLNNPEVNSINDRETTIPYEGDYDSDSLEYDTIKKPHENSQHELVENCNLNEVRNEVDISSISYNTRDKDNPVLSYTPANEKQIISNINAEDNLALNNIGVLNNPEVNSINDRETTIPYESDYDSDSLEYDTIKKSHENSQHELMEDCKVNKVCDEANISSISYNAADKGDMQAKEKQLISDIDVINNPDINDDPSLSGEEQNSLSLTMQCDYFGANVTVLLKNLSVITGEVVFNFKNIISLKTKETIIFINKDDIVAFF